MLKTEFYETAVKHGFYGLEAGGLFGKKDNVRKYWEDVSIKLSVREVVRRLQARKERIRIVDLGCGSGEGFELLTHIPVPQEVRDLNRNFVISAADIEAYVGLDISPSMLEQGRRNYASAPNVRFQQADLSEGFPLASEPPFDLYFSSYSSLSHLTASDLASLTCQIMAHARGTAYMVYDLLGRYSPEWPQFWGRPCAEMLPYNMAYLLPPEERIPERIETFHVARWSADELEQMIRRAADETGRQAVIKDLRDRSILVGRHMDTGLFNGQPRSIRRAVNCLFDRDYRGDCAHLGVVIDFLDSCGGDCPEACDRIRAHQCDWMAVVGLYAALAGSKGQAVKRLIESARPELAEEMKMLAWVYRNASRFPVADFWASVMGPQVACVLRNLEYALSRGLGCGHGLFCVVEVNDVTGSAKGTPS